MAPVWYDSFCDYSGIQPYDDTIGFAVGVGTARPYSGTQSLSSSSDFGFSGVAIKRFPVSYSSLFKGFHLYIDELSTNNAIGLCVAAFDVAVFSSQWNYTQKIDARINSLGQVMITSGGNGATIHGTSSLVLSFKQWHTFEFHAAAGVAQVRVDGQVFLTVNVSTGGPWNAFQIGGQNISNASGFHIYIADLVVLDDTGPAPLNTYLGDVDVLWFPPSGNAGTNQWASVYKSWAASTSYPNKRIILDSNGNVQMSGGGTSGSAAPTWNTVVNGTTADGGITWRCQGPAANFMPVDEQIPDDLFGYLTSGSVGETELYSFPTVMADEILAVGVDIRGWKDETGYRAVRAVASSAGTTIDNGVDLPLTQATTTNNTSFATGAPALVKGVFPVDPATGAAWTQAGVNAATFGFQTAS